MSWWWTRNRQLVLQIAGTLLAVVLLVALLQENGWSEVLTTFRKIKTTDLLWVAVLFSISRIAVVWRWHLLLRSGGIDMRFKDSMSLTFTGLFASNFLPSTIGGDVVRLAGAMQMGFDRAVCLASIAADRLIGMLGMSMTLPLGVANSWGILDNIVVSSMAVTWVRRPLALIKRTFSVFGLWIKKPASLFASLAFTWVHMLCLFGSIYIFTEDLGSHASFWMIAGLWSLTYFISLLPISINGYGLQELSFTFFMSNVAGLTPAVSLSIAVLIRAYFILSSLPGAFFLPSIMSAMAEQKKRPSPSDILL